MSNLSDDSRPCQPFPAEVLLFDWQPNSSADTAALQQQHDVTHIPGAQPAADPSYSRLSHQSAQPAQTNSQPASSQGMQAQHGLQEGPHAQQQTATPCAANSAHPPSPMCFGLLDHHDCLIDSLDGLGGLELPPLVPSQLDFEPLHSILSDMQATDVSTAHMERTVLQAQAPGSPSNSNAATAIAASLFGSSSEQQCSGTTITAAEMESCGDAQSAGSLQSRRRKLRACTRLRSMAAAASAADCSSDPWAAAGSSGHGNQHLAGCPAMQPASMHMNMAMGPMGMPMPMMATNMPHGSAHAQGAGAAAAAQWGGAASGTGFMQMGMNMNACMPQLPGQLPRGMVWGMPVHNVAVAPGIVPSCSSPPPADTVSPVPQSGAAPTLATPVAPAVRQSCQMHMPAVPMWPGGMWGGMMVPMYPFPMMAQQVQQPGMIAPGQAMWGPGGQAWPAPAAAAPSPAASLGGAGAPGMHS